MLELPSISYAAVVTAERTGLYVSELRRGEHDLKGAHAPRVLISAPSPKQSFGERSEIRLETDLGIAGCVSERDEQRCQYRCSGKENRARDRNGAALRRRPTAFAWLRRGKHGGGYRRTKTSRSCESHAAAVTDDNDSSVRSTAIAERHP